MRLTNDAAVAFADDSADGVVAESRLVAAPDDWDESRAEIVGRRDATIAGKADAVSSRELLCRRNQSCFVVQIEVEEGFL